MISEILGSGCSCILHSRSGDLSLQTRTYPARYGVMLVGRHLAMCSGGRSLNPSQRCVLLFLLDGGERNGDAEIGRLNRDMAPCSGEP